MSIRQETIKGFDQERLSSTNVLSVGAGGLNGEIVIGGARKGWGRIHVADYDIVTPDNLNRQPFNNKNLYGNKATALCRNASHQGFMGTRLTAHPCSFQGLDLIAIDPDVVVCGVDNSIPTTRLEVCQYLHEQRKPGVILGVTLDADGGYVFVQEPGKACWACVFKPEFKASNQASEDRCPGGPATIDILKALAGPALYAVDTLVMDRARDWNYWYVSLGRSDLGGSVMVEPRPDCVVCGAGSHG